MTSNLSVLIYLYYFISFPYIILQYNFKFRISHSSRNACYHSVQNPFSSSLLTKHLQIKIYRTVILSVVLFGCETWSLTLREKRRLRAFENRVLRRIFRGMEKTAK
jgi:hypothetical protein